MLHSPNVSKRILSKSVVHYPYMHLVSIVTLFIRYACDSDIQIAPCTSLYRPVNAPWYLCASRYQCNPIMLPFLNERNTCSAGDERRRRYPCSVSPGRSLAAKWSFWTTSRWPST